MSFGFVKVDDKLRKAIRRAYDNDVIMFAAASNDGLNNRYPAFPARYHSHVICIRSTDGMGEWSGFNPPADSGADNICTLGVAVNSASIRGGGMERVSGTSIATPFAAGIAALIIEFARQKPRKISERELKILHSVDGMRAIFKETRITVRTDKYAYLVPWLFLNLERGFTKISYDISDALETL